MRPKQSRWQGWAGRPPGLPSGPTIQSQADPEEQLREQIAHHLSSGGAIPPGGFHASFEQTRQGIEQVQWDIQRQIEQSRRGIRRTGRLFSWLAVLGALCGLALTVFLCWCLYHVLKAKGLVP